MEARLIKVYSTTNPNAAPVELRFSGNTQGDLLRALNISSSNVTVRGRQTRSEYPFNDSVLSTEDTFFFIGSKKMDSGAIDQNELYEIIHNLKEELENKIEETFETLYDVIDESQSNSDTSCQECEALKEEAKRLGF